MTGGPFVQRFDLAPTDAGPLDGLTFAVKDLFDIVGTVTGCGNPTWAQTHPPAAAHAPVVDRLLAAGARCVGKTVTDEFAFSLVGENEFYGTPRNPKAPGRVPGGSPVVPPPPSPSAKLTLPLAPIPPAPFASLPPAVVSMESAPPGASCRWLEYNLSLHPSIPSVPSPVTSMFSVALPPSSTRTTQKPSALSSCWKTPGNWPTPPSAIPGLR